MPLRTSENIKKLRKIVESMCARDEINYPNDKLTEQFDTIYNELKKYFKDGYWDWHIHDSQKFYSTTLKFQIGYSEYEIENVISAIYNLVYDEDLPLLLSELEKHFKTRGGHIFSVVVRFKHKSGDIIKILLRGQVVEWDGNKPLRMVGSHVDVTNV